MRCHAQFVELVEDWSAVMVALSPFTQVNLKRFSENYIPFISINCIN